MNCLEVEAPKIQEGVEVFGVGMKLASRDASAGMENPTPIEGDELEQLLDQIEVDVTVNGSTEFNEREEQSLSRQKHNEGDNGLPWDDKFVDSHENPTQLYLRINYRLWDMAVKVLNQNPSEASIWIQQSSKDTPNKQIIRNLPLHILCSQGPSPAPVILVNKLLAAYPQAIQARNSENDLPIHIACRNPAFHGMEGASVVMTLAEAYPEGMDARSGQNGLTPWNILESCNDSMSPHGATISKMLQVKLGTKRPRLVRPRAKSSSRSPLRTPPELIAKEGSDIASELNRRRLSVLMNDDKSSELLFCNKKYTKSSPSLSKDNPPEGQESRDEESNHEKQELRCSTDNIPSSYSDVGSFDTGRRPNRSASVLRASRSALKQTETLQEIELLKRRLDELREENFSNQVDRREKQATIDVLRKAVEQEREVCRGQIKTAEAQVTTLKDQLMVAQEKVTSKTKSEQELFQRVLHLESALAEKKAEMSTMKSAIQELGSSKALLQQTLQRKKEKMGILEQELSVKNNEVSALIDNNEHTRMETNKLLELSGAVQNKVNQMEHALQGKELVIEERDIQIRALTEARRASEKKMEELEQSNESLRSKSSNLTELLRKNQESFQSNLNSLESAMKLQRSDNESLRGKLIEAMSQCAAKDREIEELSTVKMESLTVCKKLEEMSVSLDILQQENVTLKIEAERLSGTLAEVENENFEKDEIILEIERANALLHKEMDTVREHHSQLQRSHDELTKKIIEEQISMGLQKLSTKNQAYKAELRRLQSVNAQEVQKSSQLLNRIASLEGKLATAEAKVTDSVAECGKLRQAVELYKAKCDDVKKELNQIRSLHHSQVVTSSDLETTISNLKERNQDLSERCNELRSIFCARIEKIEASCMKPAESSTSQLEIEPLIQTAISDLQNLVDDLREKNQMLQEECDLLRSQSASNLSDSQIANASKTFVLDNVTGLPALYDNLDDIRGLAVRLSLLLNSCFDISLTKIEDCAENGETNGIAYPDVASVRSVSINEVENPIYKGDEQLSIPVTETFISQLKKIELQKGNPTLSHFQLEKVSHAQDSIDSAFAKTRIVANELLDQLNDILQRLSEHEVFHFRDVSHALQVAHHSFHPTGFVSDLLFTHCENLLALRQLRDSNAELQLAKQMTESRFEISRKEAEENDDSNRFEIVRLSQAIVALEKELDEVSRALSGTQVAIQSLEQAMDVRSMEVTNFLFKIGEVSSSEKDPHEEKVCEGSTVGLAASVRHLIENSLILEHKVEELFEVRLSLAEEVRNLKTAKTELNGRVDDLNEELTKLQLKCADEHSNSTTLLEKYEQSEGKLTEIQTQLELSLAKNSDLQTELDMASQKYVLLLEEKDELRGSVNKSVSEIASLKKMATTYENSLREMLESIARACISSDNHNEPIAPISHGQEQFLLKQAQVAAQQIADLAETRIRMGDEIRTLKASLLAQNERMIMLKDQVDDWTANAGELRSKNNELTEKLKKEAEIGQESRKQLQDALSRIMLLSDEKVLLRNDISGLQEAHHEARREVENLCKSLKEIAGSVATLLGSTSLQSESQEMLPQTAVPAVSTGYISSTTETSTEAAHNLLRNLARLGEKIETMNEDRASLESKTAQMTDTIKDRECQIGALEESITLLCERETELEKSFKAQIDSLDAENNSLRKENAALEREAYQLRMVHENSKACIASSLEQVSSERARSISSLLAKIGILTMPDGGSQFDEARCELMANSDNIKALIVNVACLRQRLEEIEKEWCVEGEKEAMKDQRKHDIEPSEARGKQHESRSHLDHCQEEHVDVRNEPSSNSRQRESCASTSSEGAITEDLGTLTGVEFSNISDELIAANRAIWLENKILKPGGKSEAKGGEGGVEQKRLREENKALKKSIKSLTQQTTEHQQRINQLAKRQAELVRKKENWTCRKCMAQNSDDQLENLRSISESQEAAPTAFAKLGTTKPGDGTESRDDELQPLD